MSRSDIGRIGWIDLTVDDADGVRDFYGAVTGWSAEPVDMGAYHDFNMIPPGGDEPIAGVCHARGANADLPAQWLIYITVADLDASLAQCGERGGTVVAGPKQMGGMGRYAVIRDPAGAVAGLFERREDQAKR
jgi:predicted enzyme related to lactoylglutathione lyase